MRRMSKERQGGNTVRPFDLKAMELMRGCALFCFMEVHFMGYLIVWTGISICCGAGESGKP